MSNIFTLENVENFSERLNLDELYEKKRQQDLSKLELYNKILNRIHVRIKTTSRQKTDEQFCWFVVPEVIIGVPRYDQGACIAYLLDKLQSNGFNVRYIHPNTLFISWLHFVPSYVRAELKKKTGIEIDEHGKVIAEEGENDKESDDPRSQQQQQQITTLKEKRNQEKGYTPTRAYKPSGHLVYDDDLLSRLENKFS